MGRTPVKTRKAKGQAVKSSLEINADAKFSRCPEGHPLPNKTDKGRCTPLSCAVKGDLPRLRTDRDDAPEEQRIAKVKGDEELRVKIQAERRKVWQDFLQIPVDLKGADAEKYADEELVSMLPFATGVLKKQLLFGTEEQQERAANKVLDANGRGKREAPGNTTPSIVIHMTNNGGPVVDGQVVTVQPPQLPWRKPAALPAPAEAEKKNA